MRQLINVVYCVFRVTHNESSSVGKWLEDIRTMTETECMCVLQGKTLTNNSPSDQMLAAAKTAKGKLTRGNSLCSFLLIFVGMIINPFMPVASKMP